MVIEEQLDQAPCGFLALADDGTIRSFNTTLRNLLGFEPQALEGRSLASLLSVSGRLFYQTHLAPLLILQNVLEEVYLSLRSRSGQSVPVLVNAVRREREGAFVSEWVLVPIRQRDLYENDILQAKREAEQANIALEQANIALEQTRVQLTAAKSELEQRVAERTAELNEQQQFLRRVIDTDPNLIFVKDEEGTFLLANRAMAALYGTTVDEMLGKCEKDIVSDADDAARFHIADLQVIRTKQELFIPEETVTGADGQVRWLQTVKRPLPAFEGSAGHILGISTDITARKQAEKQLAHCAVHDALTGLPNRALFLDRLGQALARSERACEATAVLFVDLDNFKTVNDSFGHDAGDILLREVAQRLLGCVRIGDTVARFGGDEFVLLLEEVAGAEEALAIAERVSETLGMPLRLPAREVFPRASIGIALSGLAETTPGGLLRDADTAMYHAKTNGKARRSLFDPAMDIHALTRMELEAELRRALEEGQLRVHYQPIVQIDTGQVSEMEALVRWEHPVRGLLSPAHFIPVAEETGLIVPLGWWVLREACSQVAHWQRQYPQKTPLMIGVNLSARQLEQPDLVRQVIQILNEAGIPPGSLKLEITESVMMADPETIIPRLEELRVHGVRLAVDDFGTGYSSMSYLSSLPLDTIKIDRSFINRLTDREEDQAIVQAIIGMAKALNLDVTIEGIETAQQLQILRGMAGERGQGFYFSRPLSETATTSLFSDSLGSGSINLSRQTAGLSG